MSYAEQLGSLGTVADAEIAAGEAARATLTAEVASLNSEADGLAVEIDGLHNDIVTLNGQVVDLKVQLLRKPQSAPLFGSLIASDRSLATSEQMYGRLPVVRVFQTMPTKLPVTDRPVVVSFKLPSPDKAVNSPKSVLAGKHDAALTAWFKGLTAGQEVYYSYIHEPEDNIAAGEFSAADYTAAWRRIVTLARASGSPAKLRATMILMQWTLNPASKRNWLDYYPADDVIDVFGWDFDGLAADANHGNYPDNIYGFTQAPAIAALRNKPWLVAEFASARASADTYGARRAQWMTKQAHQFAVSGCRAVCLFDTAVNGLPATPLSTAEEVAAWKALVTNGVTV